MIYFDNSATTAVNPNGTEGYTEATKIWEIRQVYMVWGQQRRDY
ncbi:hypothetical protein KF7HA_01200 [Lactococcus lactis]|nr:hypothetical protein [Lactococcus lactis]